jgi:hypothetical protein
MEPAPYSTKARLRRTPRSLGGTSHWASPLSSATSPLVWLIKWIILALRDVLVIRCSVNGSPSLAWVSSCHFLAASRPRLPRRYMEKHSGESRDSICLQNLCTDHPSTRNPPTIVQKWLDTDYNAKSRAAAFFAGCGLVTSQLAHCWTISQLYQHQTRSVYCPGAQHCPLPMATTRICIDFHQRTLCLQCIPWTHVWNHDL